MAEEIKCLTVMIQKENEKHEVKTNWLYDRQITLMNRIKK